MDLSRRHAVLGAAALPLVASASGALAQAAPAPWGPIPPLPPGMLPVTGQETFGPYYPVRGPRGHDLDLTHYPGKRGLAMGQVIELTGRVTDQRGNPLPNAAVTMWQANAAGRYVNPVDKNPAPIDPNFLGIVDIKSGPDGTYRLRTIKPGAYPEPSGTIRTPHIHFDVSHADYRLVTQMYFPGESLNEQDILLSTLAARRRNPATVICKPRPASEPGVLGFTFDIVMLA
jgi:protocatechuate 3,4-dioxygenase beta subunit